jgi:low affinity Fe/Cu permease
MMTKKQEATPKRDIFTRFARNVAKWSGKPQTFMAAVAIIVIWAVSGPVFQYSDTWQLVINTGTTIITFLMVFLIQNTQNTDTHAMQLKLDELIRSTKGAHNVLLDLEELSDDELERIRDEYEKIASTARKLLEEGKDATEVVEVMLEMEKQKRK